MSLVECRTAGDVRALAKITADRRRKQYAIIKPQIAKTVPEPKIEIVGHLAQWSAPSWVINDSRFGAVIPVAMYASQEHPVSRIQRIVCKKIGVTRVEILSTRRFASIVRARHIGYWLAKKLTTASIPEIGRRFGGRDHSTIVHGCEQVEKKRAANPDFDMLLNELVDLVRAPG